MLSHVQHLLRTDKALNFVMATVHNLEKILSTCLHLNIVNCYLETALFYLQCIIISCL